MTALSQITWGDTKTEDPVTSERFDELANQILRMARTENAEAAKRLGDQIDALTISARATEPTEFKRQRERKARLLLRALQVIDERVDPKFGGPGDSPTLNLAPRETGAAGEVDPKTIKDPEVRRRYEEDLRRNAEKLKRSNFQTAFRRERDSWLNRRMYNFVRLNFNQDDNAAQQEWKKLVSEELKDKKLVKLLEDTFKKLDDEVIVVKSGARVARPSRAAQKSKPK
jgi:hypothetical protein